jgi:hypothetical protein
VPETPARSVELIPQPHGGALQRGNPGNSGGGTLTKNIREAFRIDLETARQRISVILDDPDADPKDIISIFDKLAKYSVGEKRDGVVVDPELLNEFFAVVGRFISDEKALETIRTEWLDVLGNKLRA